MAVDQGGLVRAPQQLVAVIVDARVGERDAPVHFARTRPYSCRRRAAFSPTRSLTCSRRSSSRSPIEPRSKRDLPALHTRRPAQIAEPGCAARAPARPSARCRWCADTRSNAARAASPACRAAWPGRADRPRRARRSSAPPGGQKTRHVDVKWRVTALVLAGELPVDPDRGAVIHGSAIQEKALPFFELGFSKLRRYQTAR